jgi:ATP-binding cassette subfamily B protein
MLNDFVMLFGLAGLLFYLHKTLALATLSPLPLMILLTYFFRNFVRDANRRIRTAIARINAFLQEHISGMPIVQLFNREQKSRQQFAELNRVHMEAYKAAIDAFSFFYPAVEFLSMGGIALLYWVGGLRVIGGTVQIGVLFAFMMYAQRFFRPIQDLSEKYNILQSAMAASERVFKLLDTPSRITSPATPRVFPEGPVAIEFDHVWFAYKNEDWVLRDVSFRIEPGETIAVVGHTGAGKTTLTNLLLRFYDIQRGAIRIIGRNDSVELRELSLDDLRRHFGVVLQDPYLFTGTVDSNIRLGTSWIGQSAVEEASAQVNLLEFVESLPDRFEQAVRERGNGFSTGQKQLISFARALAHNPRFLILDEATSSVDTETEFRVRDALAKMVEGRTSLVIAHRLSTIQRADRIFVLHKGQLRESGTHQELLALRDGIYRKLYELQYKDQEIYGNANRGPSSSDRPILVPTAEHSGATSDMDR